MLAPHSTHRVQLWPMGGILRQVIVEWGVRMTVQDEMLVSVTTDLKEQAQVHKSNLLCPNNLMVKLFTFIFFLIFIC